MQRALERLSREQQALRDSEQSFRQAFEYSPSGMAISEMGGEMHGRMLRTNDSLCRLIGRPASVLRRYSFLDLIHPEDLPILLGTSAEGGRAELRLGRRDGSYVWVSLRNSYAPVYALSDAESGTIVIAPGDARGTVLVPEGGGGYCCGLDWGDGPNMACEACGLPVASRIDDCSLWQAVWLVPNAVRCLPVDNADSADNARLSWTEVLVGAKATPPIEPITRWGSLVGLDHWWSWSPQWEATAGRALAHLLAASGGRPVTVPDGLIADVFQRTLDALLPAAQPARRAVLAGPGLSVPEMDADVILVPIHPQTGEPWSLTGPAASAYPVPLSFGVWMWMAFPELDLRLPASGTMPAGVIRDDPPAPRPHHLFRADPGTFEQTLVRLPAVRIPWLREILENLTNHRRTGLF
ncbi:PAS domain S-box protein [Streptomyces sp. NBC_00249]|nr:PAS domain S-box protein [Streptomyces sp. NBC_00249]